MKFTGETSDASQDHHFFLSYTFMQSFMLLYIEMPIVSHHNYYALYLKLYNSE